MHYTRTYQERISSSNSEVSTTSPEEIYQSELIDYVYKEVTTALKKRTKGDTPGFDLDSVEVIKKAESRVREKLLSKVGVLN